jgi:predicted DNA-binding transcriptional regulator AlpA
VPQVILRAGEAAKRLNITPRTLARWRVSGIGPAYVRVGPRCIGYLPADIDRWADARRFTSRAAELIADMANPPPSAADNRPGRD